MYSAYKLNKQSDNIQPWCIPFPIWNQSVVPCPILTVASWPAYRFLKRQVRWSGTPISLRIFHCLLWSTRSYCFLNIFFAVSFQDSQLFLSVSEVLDTLLPQVPQHMVHEALGRVGQSPGLPGERISLPGFRRGSTTSISGEDSGPPSRMQLSPNDTWYLYFELQVSLDLFCCSVAKLCLTLGKPMAWSMPGYIISFTISRSLLRSMSDESVMPSNHLILCCPLLLLPQIFYTCPNSNSPPAYKNLKKTM